MKKPEQPHTMDDRQYMRLGRTLRRISRTTRDIMKDLGITDEEMRIPRKKRKPKASEVPNA